MGIGIESLSTLVEKIKKLPESLQRSASATLTIAGVGSWEELMQIEQVLEIKLDPSLSDYRTMLLKRNVGGSNVVIYVHTAFDMVGGKKEDLDQLGIDLVSRLVAGGMTHDQIKEKLGAI